MSETTPIQPTAPELPPEPAVRYQSTVTLRGAGGKSLTIKFVRPLSLAVRHELYFAVTSASEERVAGAALGLCAPSSVGKHVRYRGQEIPAYGLEVLDYLLSQGVNWHAAVNAGRHAWRFATDHLIPEGEVQAREDFFGPSAASTTS